MADHAWCSDPSRDAAVRAAEDGRDAPLPTLGECIETAFSAGVRDSFRKVEEAWAMIPKSVSGSSPVDQENKGDGMRTERVTLEITQFNNSGYKPASEWDWEFFLRGEALTHGESVRVVSVDQPRGWLTDRDRKMLIDAAVFCSGKGERGTSEAIEWLLARLTPPEVELPTVFSTSLLGDRLLVEAQVKDALAAAGVEVKEVGK